ncbi:hypothetical protein AK812_SmicGene26372 [Symbiodinium microadriaticum]|uniref:Uncharacterized protein n=1 Tax=Symbiodinium microadriaticum TaxID=2951 RepID=A0A1Q9D9M8_SYMMI|nr:hypothetical protein AK812_SmicGene26372 [Symbiodinium microadriaticum]
MLEVIWSTDWCVKPRSSPQHFTWHQDSTYSKFGLNGCTLWLAFSHVKASSGPILYRRFSQRMGQLKHVEDASDSSNLLAFGQYIPEDEPTPLRRDRATLLSGQPEEAHFELEAPPQEELGDKELAEWRKSMDREKAMYFEGHDQTGYK